MRAYLLKLRLVGQSGGYARLNSPGSWDGTVALGLVANGAGAWSLDAVIGWDVAGVPWAVGALVLGVAGGLSVLVLGRDRRSADQTAAVGA